MKSQRIVSKLKDFDSYGADPRRVEKAGESFSGVKVDYDTKYKKSLETVKANYASLDVPYYGLDNNDYVNGLGFCCNPSGANASGGSSTGKMTAKNDNAELQQFYYHPDHLGSSSYISNLDGEVVQHVEYVPFGEVFLEEKNAKWNTPYLFTSKELDRETGMYYFGARYEDPKLGIFISVDPMAEKFKGWSSYAYALNNPLKFIDPTGMSAEENKWHPNKSGLLVKDKGDNAETLRTYVNKNYENADLSKKGAEKLYSTMKDNKVDLDKLNPETLNKNLFGYNYPGANNPKKYNGKSDYSVKPTEIEIPAFNHDKDYDKIGAVGGGGLFVDLATTTADNTFVKSMDKLVDKYSKAGEYKLMSKAIVLRDGLNAASSFKQSWSNIRQSLVVPASLTNPSF